MFNVEDDEDQHVQSNIQRDHIHKLWAKVSMSIKLSNFRFMYGVLEGGFSVKKVRMSYLWETQDSGWPSIDACQTVVPRQSSTNFSWKFGVQ